MVRRRSRLVRSASSPKRHRLPVPRPHHGLRHLLAELKDVQRKMATVRTYAYYTIPNFTVSSFAGGRGQFEDEIHAMYPWAEIEFMKKGKLSVDVRISNITSNEALRLSIYLIYRGGTVRMIQSEMPTDIPMTSSAIFGRLKKQGMER